VQSTFAAVKTAEGELGDWPNNYENCYS